MKTAGDIGRLYTLMAGDILPGLSVHNQAVLTQLFLKFSNSDGDSFEYDSASLSKKANLTPVTLRSAIKTLQSKGLVEILSRGSSHKPTRYRLKLSGQAGPGTIEQKQLVAESNMESAEYKPMHEHTEYTPAQTLPVADIARHLSFPYNWANSNMGEETLINGVLRKNRFQDVLSISAQYGLDRVSTVAAGIKDPDIRAAAEKALKRIRIGKEIAGEETKT